VIIGSTSTPQDGELLKELKAESITVIADYVERIEEFYQLADCYVFPAVERLSAIEVPLSVLEAMACNLPVVTTPFGGLPSMFVEGDGLRFSRSEEDFVTLVHSALLEKNNCKTRAMVTPYAWPCISARLLDLLSRG